MELLMFNRNIQNSLTVCHNWIIGVILQYLEPFDFVQMNESCWTE